KASAVGHNGFGDLWGATCMGGICLHYDASSVRSAMRHCAILENAKGDFLQLREARFRITEAIQFHAHPVHERQVHAAQFSVVVAFVGVVQYASRLQSAAP